MTQLTLTSQFLTIHSWERVVGAATTVFLTTLEDAVWLVPFCLHVTNPIIGIIHSIIFSATFTLLSTTIGVVTILLFETATEVATGSNNNDKKAETIDSIGLLSSLIGALLCWTLAGYFYYKAWLKKKRKQKKRQEEATAAAATASAVPDHYDPLREATTGGSQYGAIESQPLQSTNNNEKDGNNGSNKNNDESNDDRKSMSTVHLFTVVFLTIVGALDEVSYFPSLILGDFFTAAELVVGTLFASILILTVVHFFIAPCTPILKFLDQIPIYGIITAFAILLSIEVIWDLVTD